MTHYSTGACTRKYVKLSGVLSFRRDLPNKYGKQLLDTATTTGLDTLITAFKKVIHEAAQATGSQEQIANKIVTADENSRNVEEIIPLQN